MKLILIRHFKVSCAWKAFYNSQEYEKAWTAYDNSDIIDSGLRIAPKYKIVTSAIHRTIEKSRLLFGKDPDFSDSSICEVPIKAFTSSKIKLPKVIWDVIARIQWRLGSKRQPESYNESVARVNLFIDKMLMQDENLIIISHGWIIKLMIKRLSLWGYKGPRPLFIKTGIPMEYKK